MNVTTINQPGRSSPAAAEHPAEHDPQQAKHLRAHEQPQRAPPPTVRQRPQEPVGGPPPEDVVEEHEADDRQHDPHGPILGRRAESELRRAGRAYTAAAPVAGRGTVRGRSRCGIDVATSVAA